ncbi:MAG: histidine ammonia-lyase [Gemmatimonadota bacterium]|nr:histidine ammonia-lyase [Gemmatimonadota bacterium]MDH3368617.1 histidine ammonia-lyase [Gemmatimonadota bacterium]MDH3479844.1 histidine ammonia-lyase [Gemmatimonadota bacterium]MDH3570671.1 histidine ammonia-lyase [Gemmatimonadota bacterium]MDH5549466.1 histidine ammonia-lyase [Gemmatimonadota bacterium]
MPPSVILTGRSLTISEVVAVARDGARVEVDPDAAARADTSRAAVERLLATGAAIYGVNTGFGKLANVRIPPDQLLELQRNLIVSHVSGVGDPLPADVVRAVMLLRANVLLRETSGVRSAVPRHIAAMLDAGIHPVVPEQGSVGASGDLAPLAHIAWAMMGGGEVTREAGRVSTAEALEAAGLAPLEFQPKEGLAFINGTQVQTAILALVVHDALNLWRTAVGAAAMSLEALMGTPVPFDERIHEARPHPGQRRTAELLRELLADSEIRESHRENDPRVQDAYSLRCTPQILGAVADAVDYALSVVQVELNASTDNPLVFGDEILSGGNFHGQPVALALDMLAIALTTLAGLAERRIDRLLNPDLSQGLPPFLATHAGLHSGLMMMQIAAAALVAESRTLSTPASVQSIPTDANQEDVVPMGMAAAWKGLRVLHNAQRVVAGELIAAAQALEYRKPLRPAPGVARLHARVRDLVEPLAGDRPLTPDIERVAALVAREALV